MQPRVQIHAAPERAETVIREHEDRSVRVRIFQRFADQSIHVAIHALDGAGVLRYRMRRVEIAIEHMLDTVGRIENARHHAASADGPAR